MKCFSYFKIKPSRSVGDCRVTTKSDWSVNSPRSIPELYEERAHNLGVFKFSELKHATSNFSRLLKIGEDGFGCVYKGTIKCGDDAVVVAVKKLNRDGHQGHTELVAEVQFLGVVEHPNLVKLVGYCTVNGERGIQRLLVFEYIPTRAWKNIFSTLLIRICRGTVDCRLYTGRPRDWLICMKSQKYRSYIEISSCQMCCWMTISRQSFRTLGSPERVPQLVILMFQPRLSGHMATWPRIT